MISASWEAGCQDQRAVIQELFPLILMPGLPPDPAGPLRGEAQHHIKAPAILKDTEEV